MKVERFGAPLGAVIDGVRLDTVTDDEIVEIERLFAEHHVLAFPGQALDPASLKAFAARLGPLQQHPYAGMEGHPEVIELRNHGKSKNPNEHWHSDMSYEFVPPRATLLYAVDAPALGGDTAFANQHLAYDELSDALRMVIDDLNAVHSAEGLARLYRQDPKEAPRALHPVARTHPVNGQRALYVCRAFTTTFEGWRSTESRGLLDHLFEHSVRPDFQARHQWSAGDVVMWDNASVLHYAVHDHGDEPRTILRVQIQGERPA